MAVSWPGKSFSTDRPVCFIATGAELRAALPGWREPLPEAAERTGVNPFTGTAFRTRTRDPGPDVPCRIPASLPFEHVLLPNEEDWESRYVALDVVLAGQEGVAPDSLGETDALLAMMATRGLDRPALFGGDTASDPRWVLTVPTSFAARLNELDAAALPATLGAWRLRSPAASASTLDDLRDLWLLARSAFTQRREMFLWLDAPAHRCSLHRPHQRRT